MRRARCICTSSREGRQDPVTRFLHLIERCCERKILPEAKQLHSHVREHKIAEDGIVGASLVRMYIKCGSTSDARQVFDGMVHRHNMVLWTSMVAAYVNEGNHGEGWSIFFRMQQEGVLPDRVTFISILNACDSPHLLLRGKMLHDLIIEKHLLSDVAVGNSVVKMYGKCRDLLGASQFFEGMPEKDVISWTGMISANAQLGYCREGFSYYLKMLQEGVFPNNITFLAVLGACSSLYEGNLVRDNVMEAEWDTNTAIANALVNMFGKCGSLDKARGVFHGMKHKNTTSWNAMIGGCVQHGLSSEALELYHEMRRSSKDLPNKITLVTILGACENLDDARSIHETVLECGFETDVVCGTVLVNAYSKCGSVTDARRVFDGIHEKNIVSWNTMIGTYTRDEDPFFCAEAMRLFRVMLHTGVAPTRTTLLNVLSAVEALGVAEQLHGLVSESGLYSDEFIGSALVNMYERIGALELARKVFEGMSERDVYAWNAIIAAEKKKSIEFLEKMMNEGTQGNRATFLLVLNSIEGLQDGQKVSEYVRESGYGRDTNVANAMISMFGRCGCLEECRKTFECIEEKSVVSWTSMIAACTLNGANREASEVFKRMDMEPDKVTLTTMLECACTTESVNMVSLWVKKLGFERDVFVGSAMIHMYCKVANVEEARRVFERIDMPNLACWNAMLSGYAQNGHTHETIEFLSFMMLTGVDADHISFLAVVSACGHAGLVEKGTRVFGSMKEDFGVDPVVEDYGCLVDLLARAGKLEEAYEFLKEMPVNPSDVTWKTLVGACKLQGDVRRGRCAASMVLEKEPHSAAPYVEMYNMCAAEMS